MTSKEKYGLYGLPGIAMMLILLLSASLTSCSDDDEGGSGDISGIVGNWTGVMAYNNPVSGVKKNYLYLTFSDDYTGELEYEAQTSYAYALFTYSVSGGKIHCRGAWANTDEDVDANFTMTLDIHGDRLIPLDRYNIFILTRDGSVMTDGNGNEIEDGAAIIEGVWLGDKCVLDIYNDEYTLYTLPSSSSDTYSDKETGNYSYNNVTRKMWLGTNIYTVETLNEGTMVLLSSSNKRFTFRRGSDSDIPREANIRGFLTSAFYWHTSGDKYNFSFFNNGETTFFWNSDIRVGSWGLATLAPRGTYTVQGNKVTCYYTDVSWDGGQYPEYKNIFKGWTYGQSRTKVYEVSEYYGQLKIIDKEDGYEYLLTAYK